MGPLRHTVLYTNIEEPGKLILSGPARWGSPSTVPGYYIVAEQLYLHSSVSVCLSVFCLSPKFEILCERFRDSSFKIRPLGVGSVGSKEQDLEHSRTFKKRLAYAVHNQKLGKKESNFLYKT